MGSTNRIFEVLRTINSMGAATVTDLAGRLNLPYASCYRYVSTLHNEGLIERCYPLRKYRPTALTLSLSSGFRASGNLAATARPYLDVLGRRVLWPVGVYHRVGLQMVLAETTIDRSPLTASVRGTGHSFAIYPSASGQVYLAHCEPSERDSILEALVKMRAVRSSDIGKMQSSIDKVKKYGYAITTPRQNGKPVRLSYFAVPIFLPGSRLATLALTYFASSMSAGIAVETFLGLLIETAGQISSDVGSHPLAH